jgi:hypothetical protein
MGGGVTVWVAGVSCAKAGVAKSATPINSAARGLRSGFFIITKVK